MGPILLHFPTFHTYQQSVEKDHKRWNRESDCSGATMENASVVPQTYENVNSAPNVPAKRKTCVEHAIRQGDDPSPSSEDAADCMPRIRNLLSQIGIKDDQIKKFIINSWRKSTRKQYMTYITKWEAFCLDRGFDTTACNVNNLLEFLLSLALCYMNLLWVLMFLLGDF